MRSGLLICVIALTTLVIPQETTSEGFTTSPTEHIIVEVEKPFYVRSVKGVVVRKQGDKGPLEDVLVEIKGPDGQQSLRRTITNRAGNFKFGSVPEGTYKFKVTLNGFQSVIGTIVVSKEAPSGSKMKIALPVGV